MASNGNEIEIKLRVESPSATRKLLRDAGFQLARRRVFEANTVFDKLDLEMRSSQQLLRVREAGNVVTVTYKGPPKPSRHKNREELEVEVTAAGQMTAIFQRLGFRPVFRYEKYRTEFRCPQSTGLAMLDETSIGVFLELEGPSRWIDQTARRLGFRPKDYILASYGRLYLDWCAQNAVPPSDMLLR